MKRTIYFLLTTLLLAAVPAFAQVPNESALVKKLYDTGLYDLRTEAGHGAFVDVVASTLHAKDERWLHLKKKPGQTQVHGHAEDAVIYLMSSPALSPAVDFIGGSGGNDPKPGWIVQKSEYTAADGLEPTAHVASAPPAPVCPPPTFPGYPQPETAVDGAGQFLFADFAEAGQAPNPQMFRFAFRVAYDWMAKNVATLDASIEKHRKEWRGLLGLPPVPQP
jgi:hypothetical protein